ncbi:hypothetical protein Taro_015255 [Colocasia esculenta]|uniref:Uncharacterized protein n=1 Tax=Colocasia esculenta TaxID=4460 RepID=A0A843UH99_COLES|nr:hypothetical protein [Colocasia esculenta]
MARGYSCLQMLAMAMALLLVLPGGQQTSKARVLWEITTAPPSSTGHQTYITVCQFLPGGCRPPADGPRIPANPYWRGCSSITRCRGGIGK